MPRKLTAPNNFRNPRLPKNYAIGFTVSKKPNTLTPATKKQLQKIHEKKENINARIALYDELHDCNIYTDPEDSDNVVDLFEDGVHLQPQRLDFFAQWAGGPRFTCLNCS